MSAQDHAHPPAVPCPFCDYDLSRTGRGDQVQCPECGRAVSRLAARHLQRGRELTPLRVFLWIGVLVGSIGVVVVSGVAVYQELGWLAAPFAVMALGALVFCLHRIRPRRHREYMLAIFVWAMLCAAAAFIATTWRSGVPPAAPEYRILPGW